MDMNERYSFAELCAPFFYLGLMVVPFIWKNTFFAKPKTEYQDMLIIFVNINRLTSEIEYSIENPYHDETLVYVKIYLENENDYNIKNALKFDIFKSHTINTNDLESTLFNLREFCDFCQHKLNRKPIIILDTNDPTYEIIMYELDIHKVINIKRMYGCFNTDEETIPSLTSVALLKEILVKNSLFVDDEDEIDPVDEKEALVQLLDEW